jgi:hypothetical protein
MSSACAKVVMVVGVGVALALAVVSILNIGLYGGAMDLDVGNCQGPCRERTGAIGIVAGVLGFILSLVVVAAFLLPLFVSSMAEPLPATVLKLVLLVCLFVVMIFYITAWSLMAKDINDWRDAVNGACDDMAPDVWNAALAFGLFGFFITIILFVVLAIALVVDRKEGGGGGGGGGSHGDNNQHPAKDEYN